MQRWFVEAYVPRCRAEEARAAGRRASGAAAELTAGGTPVRYVRTTLLPEDETCFHVFEAGERESVEEACRRAGLGRPRISAAIEASRSGRPPGR